MLSTFVIVLREGFESFLIVAIILAYLRKTGRPWLSTAVYLAIAASIIASAALGYMLGQGVNQSLWEGVLGLAAVVMVASLLIHMWKSAPHMKQEMQRRMDKVSVNKTVGASFLGIFLFTLLMITREGMETAMLLLNLRGVSLAGVFLGLTAAASMCWLWARFGHRINVKRFFQVTAIFLMLFLLQVAIYSFHELAEAGIFPNSESLHDATEAFSHTGLYGKWFSPVMLAICAAWLVGGWIADRSRRASPKPVVSTVEHPLIEKAP